MSKIILALFTVHLLYSGANSSDLIVTTKSGKVLGKTAGLDLAGNEFYGFESIPFAQPPVGDLRFRDPIPVKPWKDILNATAQPPPCPQIDDEDGKFYGNENCLYLNVYTPNKPQTNESTLGELLPVMVFIHGGAFRIGSASGYGSEFLVAQKVVLAIIQYRLGVLGFLHSNDDTVNVPGNAALKDQVLAMKWIKHNIRSFGGNPDSITVFGESSGSVSVHLHTLSPMSKGLFHKAIGESGSALFLGVDGIRDNAKILGRTLNIDTSNNTKLISELKKIPVESLIVAQNQISPVENVSSPSDFSLVVEKHTSGQKFLPDEPIKIIRSGIFNQVPLIMGYNSIEGLVNQVVSILVSGQYDIIKDYKENLPYILKTDKADEIAKKVEDYYKKYNDHPITPSVNFMTDTLFLYDIYKSVLEQSKVSKTPLYFYRFSADTKLNFFKNLVTNFTDYPGACHVDELGYLFKFPLTITVEPGSIEDITLKRVLKLWVNFAKYGNPTPKEDVLFNNLKWEPFSPDKKFLFEIGNNISVSTNPDYDRFQFWTQIYKTYLE